MKELITDYWAQISLIIIGLGYLTKIVLDYLTKRKSINHSLFQQNKIDALKDFLASYSDTLLMINRLPIVDIALNKIPIESANELMLPQFSKLETTIVTLRLFIDAPMYDELVKVSVNINKFIKSVDNLYLEKSNGNQLIMAEHVAELRTYISFKNSRIIMEAIQKMTKSIR